MFKYLIKNWKTTLAGLLIAVLTALKYSGKITPETYEIFLGILSASGLLAAKDSNISGTTP